MPRGDRGGFRKAVTAIFIAGLAALVLKTTWELSSLNTNYPQEAEQAAKEYADRTQQRITSTCLDTDRAAFAECVSEIIKSTQEAQTAQRDLAAQRSMALWTFGMFWASVVAVGVTAVGLWFVWRTLEATRIGTSAAVDAAKEAAEANQIMRDEQRPWITLEVEFPNGLTITNDAVQLNVRPILENIGSRLAYDVWVEVKVALQADGVLGNPATQFTAFWIEVNNRRLRNPWPNGRVAFPHRPQGDLIFRQELRGSDLQGVNLADANATILPHVFVCCLYRIAAEGPLRMTAQSYSVARNVNGNFHAIKVRDQGLSAGALVASTNFQPSNIT